MKNKLPEVSTCRVCGGPLRPWLTEVTDPQTGELFAVPCCESCGLGQTVPQPEDLGPYYGPAYHGGRHGFTATWCARRRLGWMTSSAGAGAGRRLLDVGCGDGTFLLAARTRGWVTVGTEMNPGPGRKAGLDVRENLEQADDGNGYDCITLWHSLEHMRDPGAVLASLAGMLRPEGLLLIAVPDAGGLQARIFGRHWLHLDVPRHLWHFNQLALERLLVSRGFTAFRRWHQEFEYDLFGWVQSALNALLPNPNLLFALLTGRRPAAGGLQLGASILLGAALALPGTLLVWAGTICRHGGTLVLAARPSSPGR